MGETTKVFCGNLPDDVDKRDLEDAFGKFGKLSDVWVARRPPGFAFIHFEDPNDAKDAVRDLNGTQLLGRDIRVEVSNSRRRGGGGGRYDDRRDRYDDRRDRYDDRRDRYDDRRDRYDDRRDRYDDRRGRYDDRYDDRRGDPYGRDAPQGAAPATGGDAPDRRSRSPSPRRDRSRSPPPRSTSHDDDRRERQDDK